MIDLDRFPDLPTYRREESALERWQREGWDKADDMEEPDENPS